MHNASFGGKLTAKGDPLGQVLATTSLLPFFIVFAMCTLFAVRRDFFTVRNPPHCVASLSFSLSHSMLLAG
jgi:hypothetical protein